MSFETCAVSLRRNAVVPGWGYRHAEDAASLSCLGTSGAPALWAILGPVSHPPPPSSSSLAPEGQDITPVVGGGGRCEEASLVGGSRKHGS